jgi:hypothetical protein
MKKSILQLFILAIVICKPALGQWSQIGYMAISPDTANNVSFYAGFGSNLYAASNKGIFKSTNNGNSWTGLTYTTAVTQTLSMLSVYEESVTTIYAGSDKRLYKSTNSGGSWTWLPLPMDTVQVTDIQKSGNNLLVSYNKSFSKGGVFYSSNSGLTWSSAAGIPAVNFMQDLVVEGDTVYVGGKGGVFKSTDKGVTFTALGTGLPQARTITRHGGNLFAGDGGGTGLYISVNNGLTWNPANASVFGGFCQIFSIEQAPGIILAAIDGATCSTSGSTSLQMSGDGGSTWVPYMSGLPLSYYSKVGTNSSNSSFFTNKGKQIYRTNATTGIQNYSVSSGMKLFFDEEKNLNIKIANTTNVDVKIFSVNGSLMYESSFSESELKIREMANAAPGVYLVMLSSGNKAITQKIVKQD